MPQCVHKYHVKTTETHLIYGRNYSHRRWELCDEGLIPNRRRDARPKRDSEENVERKARPAYTYISEKELEAPTPRRENAESKTQRFQRRAEQRKTGLQKAGLPKPSQGRVRGKKDKVK